MSADLIVLILEADTVVPCTTVTSGASIMGGSPSLGRNTKRYTRIGIATSDDESYDMERCQSNTIANVKRTAATSKQKSVSVLLQSRQGYQRRCR
jgi:hypothetical protein